MAHTRFNRANRLEKLTPKFYNMHTWRQLQRYRACRDHKVFVTLTKPIVLTFSTDAIGAGIMTYFPHLVQKACNLKGFSLVHTFGAPHGSKTKCGTATVKVVEIGRVLYKTIGSDVKVL